MRRVCFFQDVCFFFVNAAYTFNVSLLSPNALCQSLSFAAMCNGGEYDGTKNAIWCKLRVNWEVEMQWSGIAWEAGKVFIHQQVAAAKVFMEEKMVSNRQWQWRRRQWHRRFFQRNWRNGNQRHKHTHSAAANQLFFHRNHTDEGWGMNCGRKWANMGRKANWWNEQMSATNICLNIGLFICEWNEHFTSRI